AASIAKPSASGRASRRRRGKEPIASSSKPPRRRSKPATPPPVPPLGAGTFDVLAAVLMVIVIGSGLTQSITGAAGEKLHAAWLGSPEQDNVTGPVKFISGSRVRLTLAGCPADVVADG